MAIAEIKKNAQAQMDKSINALGEELKKIRTGRAQVSMLDSIRVNYYGNPSPLSQVASVSTPDAKSFLIAPWEVSILKDIEQAIIKSELGMAPMNDGKVIRLKVPDLTEERRKDLAKQVKKIAEEARVAVRMARRDANEAIKKMKADKKAPLSEDEAKKGETDIQKVTDDMIKKVDQIAEEKEKSILTI
ncbi:ribosome recycling factor [Bdellovibrio sp. SKB1291214]|uniref:ribosome recycling factor n=1 Tax=Bdellovibrio sp. SKB1291214 TaxID=1732569 RepID=UPI000B515C13|nr:ribosome recycling factor [Bdellovibrio sp. SKB1291214]UYL10659.1 ribosome recycling factor [Bdellovibrio sp. SKB1291214]